MQSQFIPPTAPAKVIAARDHAEKLRGAIARATETANATAAAIAEAEKAYRAECCAAALDGTGHPKTPAALREMRERAESAENTKAALERQLAEATAEHLNAHLDWATALLREQLASDASGARQAFGEAVAAVCRMAPLCGFSTRAILVEFAEALPRSDFGRNKRYAWAAELFGEVGARNPLSEAAYLFEAEANFLRPDEARHAAKKATE